MSPLISAQPTACGRRWGKPTLCRTVALRVSSGAAPGVAPGPLVPKGCLQLLPALEVESRNRENPRRRQDWGKGLCLEGLTTLYPSSCMAWCLSGWQGPHTVTCVGTRSARVPFAGETAAQALSFLDAASVRSTFAGRSEPPGYRFYCFKALFVKH